MLAQTFTCGNRRVLGLTTQRSTRLQRWDCAISRGSGLDCFFLLSRLTASFSIISGLDPSLYSNTGDSRMVTHCSTSPAISCLNTSERTGSLAPISSEQ
ncbi:hypothetical protein K440DRAFT_223137 [Wilcoxina mikolae CBS 423.85]|nr:hypothetical protein K440DRAFT_223137 [Wilcoxina mikolae CBS 423.85]